jgi:hypothetical protein
MIWTVIEDKSLKEVPPTKERAIWMKQIKGAKSHIGYYMQVCQPVLLIALTIIPLGTTYPLKGIQKPL